MNIVESIQSALYERVVSPLGGMFAITWSLMHYEILMILFSKYDVTYKMQVVHESMVVDAVYRWEGWIAPWLAPLFEGLIIPVVFSFVGLGFYSALSILAFKISMSAKVELRNIKHKKEGEVIVTKSKYDRIVDFYNNKIDILRDRESRLEGDVNRLDGLHKKELEDFENKVLIKKN